MECAASSGSMLSPKSSSEKNYELGGYIGNTLGHTLLAQLGTA
jgi:hypothetical protein